MGSTFLSPPAKRSRVYLSSGMSDATSNSINGSSKRSKLPPLIVPYGQISFRMLCHESRIGGVIGKSGQVIKQLQQTTGAKIRIEDAPPESSDRVVTVVAPTALTSKLSLVKNPIDVKEEVIEVSKAQEALLKVFERILEVAAEKDGVGLEADIGVVSCRLLAEVAQIGSVIGKGGRVVEKIRKESGCKIRVFTEKLPACAGPTDEMIEIEGDVLAIKKALIAVSRCLQECPPVDKTRKIASRLPEGVSCETLPDLRVDHLLQRSSILPNIPSSSSSFASGVHPLSIDANRIPTLDTKPVQKEVVFKILCANERVGGVIGKGGAIIKALQNESGATISVSSSIAECDERLITITAPERPESRYSPAQRAIILVFSRSLDIGIEKGEDSGTNKGSPITARLVIPTNQVGCLLGKGGAIVAEMRKVTGTSIRIIGGDQVPKCVSEQHEVVQISGEFSNVQDALYHVTGRLRDNLFSTVLSHPGRRSSSSGLTDTSPYGRLIDPPTPTGSYSTPSVGVSHSFNRLISATRSMDHFGLPYSLDRPPSPPRLWASQTLAGGNSRGMTEVRGLTSLKGGLDLGSGSKSAIVTNTTVEIVVPGTVIGSVYGENGSNLARLKQISGARVIVHEPRPGTTDRIVVISGTPNETQAAQSLLHAFILTGQS